MKSSGSNQLDPCFGWSLSFLFYGAEAAMPMVAQVQDHWDHVTLTTCYTNYVSIDTPRQITMYFFFQSYPSYPSSLLQHYKTVGV